MGGVSNGSDVGTPLTSPTEGFPGGSLGRDGGRGGGGGGVGLTDNGVAGRTGEEDPEEERLDRAMKQQSLGNDINEGFSAYSPLLVPPAPGVGDDIVVRYVGGGAGGGGVFWLLCLVSSAEGTF